jgi:tetratricopeptide (TPR) repeat protein
MKIEIVDTPKIPTLCLNMIVRNESRIIRRLLESVCGVIDSYCICDTGSTDNTVEIIETFFQEKGIPGKIVSEPFRDFAYNRSFALKACEDQADFALLLDADMVFWKRPDYSVEEFKRALTTDAYYIFQGSDSFYYKNTRIVKTNRGIHYWGVTHEFVKTPDGTQYGSFEKPNVFIQDIGDGGCKSDKFERDIRLLKQGLADHPNNDRYTFYLANSYRDHGDYREAIETYRKRIEIGGWIEEVWHSHYSIGKCYKQLGDMPNAIMAWLDAYECFPKRIENLYEIVSYYRQAGKNELAYLYYVSALKQLLLNPTPDYLFLQKDVYDYKLDYEFSIVGYYANLDKYDMRRICHKVLNARNAEESVVRNVLSNYKFYAKPWSSIGSVPSDSAALCSVGQTLLSDSFPEFVGSTPSVAFHGGELAVVQRFVNYRINDTGGYVNQKHISTKNVVATFDVSAKPWRKTREFEMNYDRAMDSLYVGLEDVRIMSHQGALLYNANRGISIHHLMVEHGTVDVDTQQTQSGLVLIDDQKQIEKNWVLFEDGAGNLKIIYGWSDLVIGDVVAETELPSESDSDDEPDNNPSEAASLSYLFKKTHAVATPAFFKYIRGSTNGVRVGDEVWFVCHVVSYEDRRYYYHVFVALDAWTYAVKKYTPMSTFEGEKVEYTLGFVYLSAEDAFLVGYSKMDRETAYMTIPKSAIETQCLYG